MGDGIKAMYDDYDDYERLCKWYGEQQKPMYGSTRPDWMDHHLELERRMQEGK